MTACHILSLSAPLLPLSHTAAELSLRRTVTAGLSFTLRQRTSPAIQISSIISSHCSTQVGTVPPMLGV